MRESHRQEHHPSRAAARSDRHPEPKMRSAVGAQHRHDHQSVADEAEAMRIRELLRGVPFN